MKPTDKPKRKINAPKRFGCEDNNKDKDNKKNKSIKNLECSRCEIDITLNNINYFELNTKLYCNLCYNDIINKPTIIPTKPTITPTKPTITPTKPTITPTNIPTIIPTNIPTIIPPKPTIIPTHIPKIKFIIMNNTKTNPNLINIINNKTQLLEKAAPKIIAKNSNDDKNNKDEEKQDLENPERKTAFEKSRAKNNTKNDDDDDEEDYNEDENEEEDYNEDDDDDDDETYNNSINYDTSDFNNLFLNSIINRINNLDKSNKTNNKDSGCCGPTIVNNKQKHKGNKNKDDGNDDKDGNDDNDNNDTSLEYEWLGSDIKDIDDLIRIGKTYNPKKRKRHNLNLKKLNKLVEPLIELKNMIGMKEVKKIIFDQIIYYLQNLDDKNVDMLHTVIVGPPGVGKTQLTHIIAKIYNKLGFLKTDKVICAKRDDLIGEYIGQTAPKTRKVLESALGGVLLLDEVYALSPNSEKDFAREAIDMINVYLSEHCHDLVCVIAGYKKPTYENFLAHNEGLARRFTHHFEIKGYDAEELTLIFKKYLEEQKWQLSSSIDEMKPIIEKNLKIFPNFGGDMTTLFACCKKTHSKRLLLIASETELNNTKKHIHIDDIEKGIKLFIEIKTKGGEDIEDKDKFVHMYS